MAMAALEFDDYALIWWEQMLNDREEAGQGTVRTWAEMKREMRARFVPRHHRRDLFDKLQNLKQGSLSVDEYYKEMEKAMIRANVYEDQEQSIARFMLVYIAIFSALLNVSRTVILLSWYIKQAKLSANCSKT
jgi:polyribonucleotide nucleotidyltransferase